jgi:hypothetical protein
MTGNVSHGATEITENIDDFGELESFMRRYVPRSGRHLEDSVESRGGVEVPSSERVWPAVFSSFPLRALRALCEMIGLTGGLARRRSSRSMS